MAIGKTTWNTKLNILSKVWVEYRKDEDWSEIIFEQATGFAFAYGLFLDYFDVQDWEGASKDVRNIVNSAWNSLLDHSGVADTGFSDWNDFIDKVNA